MNPAEKQQLKALLVATSMYYGVKLPDDVLALYVEDLHDLPFVDVARAMGEIRRDPKTTRCPLPAVIRVRLHPEADPESEAVMITGRILSAISRIGPYRAEEARIAIGEIGWKIVESQGGWENLCQIDNDDIGIHRAQWRSHAKALLVRGVTPIRPSLRDGRQGSGGLTSIGDLLPKPPEDDEGAA